MRKIVVEGKKYLYVVGKGTTVIRREDNTVLSKVKNHELVGVDSEIFHRGKWKRTSDGMVRPVHIACFIANGDHE